MPKDDTWFAFDGFILVIKTVGRGLLSIRSSTVSSIGLEIHELRWRLLSSLIHNRHTQRIQEQITSAGSSPPCLCLISALLRLFPSNLNSEFACFASIIGLEKVATKPILLVVDGDWPFVHTALHTLRSQQLQTLRIQTLAHIWYWIMVYYANQCDLTWDRTKHRSFDFEGDTESIWTKEMIFGSAYQSNKDFCIFLASEMSIGKKSIPNLSTWTVELKIITANNKSIKKLTTNKIRWLLR